MATDNLNSLLHTLDEALGKISESGTEEKQAGTVRSARDGIIQIEGLSELRMGEVVRIPEAQVDALVMQIGKEENLAVVLQPGKDVRTGLVVESTGKYLSIPASNEVLGRVIDPLGRSLDEKPEIKADKMMPLEASAPGVIAREPVSQPVQTGILAIDSLIPVGRGQRELIIGDRQTGKTTIAIDTILNQKDQNMVCVYVAVAQRDAKTTQVIQTLREQGALDYTVVVSASASQSAVLQFLAPYAGVAIAEYFMQQGRDVLVIYDDLSKHAVAYREMSLLLRKPPGREAYPGDVFYIHSRLLERAARLNEDHGGGSITALPIIETQAGDVSAYVPTNVISITDGQIFLESSLFYRGVRPAINVGISVSRVGGAAQTKIMKKVSGSAKLDLAQYYDLAEFSQFASDLDPETKKQLTRGERVVESMKQAPNQPYKLWQEVVVIWTSTKGHLDEVPLKEVQTKIQGLLERMEQKNQDLIELISDKKELTDEIAEKLENIVSEYFKGV